MRERRDQQGCREAEVGAGPPELPTFDARKSQVAELRFFGGLSRAHRCWFATEMAF